ncbi:BTB/POZ domain-containing protein 6-A [Aphelenchoides avenae]|nr:BTB/POZ domain-containing protein 6-A [Aphelenchus avenae]
MPVTLTSEIAECPVRLDSIVLEPELADVQISVSCDKETKLFHAHKLVLAVGSDVFKTMFFGSVPQPNPVVITDSTPAAFEAFLRFVYTGTTTVDEAEIFPMLNLAKKYLVGSLSKVLLNYVEESITSENVGQILLNGQNFLDDAPLRFWESVECHGEALLKSDEFLQLRKDTVQALLQREPEAEESLVYEKAVAWAKAECSRNRTAVSGEGLRTALEGIVHQIRFPTMSAEEFARGPASETILSAEVTVCAIGASLQREF